MATRKEPTEGSVWRERRRAYRKRKVLVLEVDDRVVGIRTLINEQGARVLNGRRSRVRRSGWHSSWEHVADSTAEPWIDV